MNHLVWEASPVIFSLAGFQLRWYSLFFVLSFYISHKFMERSFIKADRKIDDLEPLFWYCVLGVVLGARLGHCLLYEPAYYLKKPLEILMVWKGGLASHGGGLGLLIALIMYCKKYKESLLFLLDQLSIPMALSASLIRMGNFFNSEIIGKESGLPWAIIFKRVDLVPRHPAQLYEALFYFITFILLLGLNIKLRNHLRPGRLFGVFISLVFTARILIEFVKLPQEAYDTTLGLNTGQLLSIPFIIAGLYFCFFYKAKSGAKQASVI